MNSIKEIQVNKNRGYWFFDNLIIVKNLDPNKVGIDENSCKNILIYNIEYVTFRDLRIATTSSVNLLFIIIKKMIALKKVMEINIGASSYWWKQKHTKKG